jgi:hypothetical protein
MFAVILISYALAAASVALMSGAVEGTIAVVTVREGVRSSGFPDGLGPLSEDYGQGIIVQPQGDPLGKKVAVLTALFEEFKWAQGRVFYVKIEEAKTVFKLLEAIDANGYWTNLAKLMSKPPHERAEYEEFEQFLKSRLTIALVPLNDYLKSFPTGRTSMTKTPTVPTAQAA